MMRERNPGEDQRNRDAAHIGRVEHADYKISCYGLGQPEISQDAAAIR